MLRQSIGFMSQDTVLMNDSIRANICAGTEKFDEDKFNHAVEISGVAQFCKNHPQGFNLNVGPRGEHLSGGERQAVGLARAILQNPAVLLLDEPTSAMDNSAENNLIKILPEFLSDKTVIIATHRMQLLKLVDRIIWMDNGRIVADGPKDEVLSSLKRAG
jgi:ATP-binding cassette subfamily C protein LapB